MLQNGDLYNVVLLWSLFIIDLIWYDREPVDRKEILAEIKHQEFLAYGTAQIFENEQIRIKILWAGFLFLGTVMPITVGGVYLAFSKSTELIVSA